MVNPTTLKPGDRLRYRAEHYAVEDRTVERVEPGRPPCGLCEAESIDCGLLWNPTGCICVLVLCRACWMYEDDKAAVARHRAIAHADPVLPLPMEAPAENTHGIVVAAAEELLAVFGENDEPQPACLCNDDEPGHIDPRCPLWVAPEPKREPVCACLKCYPCQHKRNEEMQRWINRGPEGDRPEVFPEVTHPPRAWSPSHLAGGIWRLRG